MYSNVFDTVRNSNIDLMNCEGLLYSSILNGLHPTFSLNQAIDSTALVNIIKNDNTVLNFIKKGYIRIALYGKYTGKNAEITSFLTKKLSECIAKDKASFRFSALPFLYNSGYEEKQLIDLYQVMGDVIAGNRTSVSTYAANDIGINSTDTRKINDYLQTIKMIEDAVQGQYILPAKTKIVGENLYEKLQKEISIYIEEIKDDELCLAIKELKKLLKKERQEEGAEQKINSRSFIYKLIEELKCSQENEKEMKSIVDLCYNEVVAASIGDDEDDIMVTNNYYKYADVWSNNIDNDNDLDQAVQKLSLLRNPNRKSFSWQLLENILQEVQPCPNDLNQWYCDMEEYCRSLEMRDIKLGQKMLLGGTVSFAVSVLSDSALEVLFDESLQDIVCSNLISASLGKAGGYIASMSSFSNVKGLNKSEKERLDTIKPLLTQTALLKRDYGRER